jgi:hypothetical protein
VNDFHLEFEASDLGLNVIDQLAEMVLKLESGLKSQCYFYLEPAAYVVVVEPKFEIVLLRIEFVSEFDNDDISETKILLEQEIDLSIFRVSLIKALQDFQNLAYEQNDWPLPKNPGQLHRVLGSSQH